MVNKTLDLSDNSIHIDKSIVSQVTGGQNNSPNKDNNVKYVIYVGIAIVLIIIAIKQGVNVLDLWKAFLSTVFSKN